MLLSLASLNFFKFFVALSGPLCHYRLIPESALDSTGGFCSEGSFRKSGRGSVRGRGGVDNLGKGPPGFGTLFGTFAHFLHMFSSLARFLVSFWALRVGF